MKKGIVGLILGVFLIALFTSPTFANPGPPNPNAPYQNIKDIKPTLNEGSWGEIQKSPQPIRIPTANVKGRNAVIVPSQNLDGPWNLWFFILKHLYVKIIVGPEDETGRNCASVGNSN